MIPEQRSGEMVPSPGDGDAPLLSGDVFGGPVPREVALAVGAVALVGKAAVVGGQLARAGARRVMRLPLVGPLARAGADRLSAEGERLLTDVGPVAVESAFDLISRVVTEIVGHLDITSVVRDDVDLDAIAADLDIDAILARVDLNAIIRERVDINAVIRDSVNLDEIAKGIDIGAIVERVDVDAILARVDLIAIANDVIDGVDLTEIIREASTSVTADVMTDVRSSGERADDAVAHLVSRVLHRRSEEKPGDTHD